MIDIFKKAWAVLIPRQRRNFLIVLIGSIVMAAMETVGIGIIFGFISIVSDPGLIQEIPRLQAFYEFISPGDMNYFLLLTGFMVLIVFIVKNIVVLLVSWMQARFSAYNNYYMVQRLLHKFFSYPYSFYLQQNTSSLRHIVFGEVDRVSGGVLNSMLVIISECFVGMAIIGLLLWHDWKVSMTIILVLTGIYSLIYLVLGNLSFRLGKVTSDANDGRYRAMAHFMDGMKEIKVIGNERSFIENYGNYSGDWVRVNAKLQILSQFPRLAIETLAFGVLLAIILYYLYLGQPMSSIIAVISLYALAGYRLMPTLNRLLAVSSQLRSSAQALDNVYIKLYETETESEDYDSSYDPIPFQSEIRLSNITYQYPETDQVAIKNLDLVIDARTSVGIIGASGAGKSTLMDILLGLLEPTQGEILVDSQVIEGIRRRQWRTQTGYVPQQIFLFDDTLAKNIAFNLNNNEIDMDAVENAARIAHLHEFAEEKLPDKYNSIVGERGIRLSGGQKQRIAIARALYREPSLLLLDEATSALDSITERIINDTIQDMRGKLTLVIIAHRLSTVRNCNVIHLMEEGRFIDSGTYDDLIGRHQELTGSSN